MWSLGCIVAELYCGHPIFPAQDENELFEFQSHICGIPPDHMLEDSSKVNVLFRFGAKNSGSGGGISIIKSPRSRLDEILRVTSSLTIDSILFKEGDGE